MNKIEHIKLKNGINIYYYSSALFNTPACIFDIGSGSFMEDRGVNNGWSHLLAHMMFKNSKKWTTRDRLNKFTENAVEWNAYTGSEDIYFYFNCPNVYYEEIFDIYLDMLFNPSFDEDELKVERNVVLSEKKQFSSKDNYKCVRAFIEKGFTKKSRKTFFTNSTIGLVKDLKNCDSKSLRDLYEKYFDPRNITIIMVGPPRNYDKLVKKIEALNLKPHKYNIISKVEERIKIANEFEICSGFDLMKTEERNSSLVFIWKNAAPAKMLKEVPFISNIIIAYKEYLGGGPNSLLWNRLREEKGYTYAINLYNEVNPFTSYHYIASEVNNSKLEPFFKDLCNTMDEFKEKGIDDDSLNRILKSIKNNYYHEKNDAFVSATHILISHQLGLPIITLKENCKKFSKIDKGDINEYHKIIWREHKCFVTGISTQEKCEEMKDILYKYKLAC